MFSLPNRPGPYLLLLLLAALGAMTVWMLNVLEDPAVRRAALAGRAARESTAPTPAPQGYAPSPPPPLQNTATDPVIVQMHDEMIQPETPPERELEIVQELISQQQRAMGPGSFGDNNDITSALVGPSTQGVWLPRQSPRIRNGELLDRWGTPYWFHSNAGNQIEIRSAGPDKSLFTSDDVILNGSPAGFGATPGNADQ